MAFKIRNEKNINSDNRFTLETKHFSMLNNHMKTKQSLLSNRKKIIQLKNELKHSIKKNNCYSMNELDTMFDIQDKLKNIKQEIKIVNNNEPINNYLLKSIKFFNEYYKSGNNDDDFPVNNVSQSNLSEIITINKSGQKKASIYHNYLKQTDPQYYLLYIYDSTNKNYCEICKNEKIALRDEGKILCMKCGIVDINVIENMKPVYKDLISNEINTLFSYKKINHFNETMSQFQGKESTYIPDEVIQVILSELKKEKITDFNLLTPDKIKFYLKKNKKNKYYEHIPYIRHRITGILPPKLSHELEEKLRNMFREIQAPFIKVCPPERQNFISYSFVFHKFFELLDCDEFLPYFPYLKSRNKLKQMDLIWKKVVNYLNWQFIPSV
jgi:hypothetical protein